MLGQDNVGKFEQGQWKSARSAEQTGLCGRISSLLWEGLAEETSCSLKCWQVMVTPARSQIKEDSCGGWYSFPTVYVLSAQRAKPAQLNPAFLLCYLKGDLPNHPDLPPPTWNSKGASGSQLGLRLIQVSGHIGSGISSPHKGIRQQILVQEFTVKTVTNLYPDVVGLEVHGDMSSSFLATGWWFFSERLGPFVIHHADTGKARLPWALRRPVTSAGRCSISSLFFLVEIPATDMIQKPMLLLGSEEFIFFFWTGVDLLLCLFQSFIVIRLPTPYCLAQGFFFSLWIPSISSSNTDTAV